MTAQLAMNFPEVNIIDTPDERIVELPEMLHCDYHSDYAPLAYYTEKDIIEMLDFQGWIDCPLCILAVAGGEAFQ